MDEIALIVAIVALCVSGYGIYKDNKREIEINRINLEADYYKDIYKQHLIRDIPNARKFIGFTPEGNLRDTKELREELNYIRQDSLYFLYSNNKYYKGLKKRTQDLEDFLLRAEEGHYVGEERTEVYVEIQKKISNLYNYILDNYLGNKC